MKNAWKNLEPFFSGAFQKVMVEKVLLSTKISVYFGTYIQKP